jgi:hypothetical protein
MGGMMRVRSPINADLREWFKMLGRIMDRLFGKRHVTHWPRGVVPLFPEIWAMQKADPELWELTKWMNVVAAMGIWRERHPELFESGDPVDGSA